MSVKNQDARSSATCCGKALAIDVNANIPDRLENVINQRQARWLLDHASDYFLVDEGDE